MGLLTQQSQVFLLLFYFISFFISFFSVFDTSIVLCVTNLVQDSLSEELPANMTAEMVATILSQTPETSALDPSMGVSPESFHKIIKTLVGTEVMSVQIVKKCINYYEHN